MSHEGIQNLRGKRGVRILKPVPAEPPHDLRANVLDYTAQVPEGLLPRDRRNAEVGEFHTDVSEQIVNAILSTGTELTQHFMLSGEPSSGKTTELKRIATALLKHQDVALDVLPIYSELQYAIAGDVADNSFWTNLVSGSADPELGSLEHSTTLNQLQNFAAGRNEKIVLFIDTLDILLLDNHKGMATKWAEFLASATEHSVTVIWTCRPYEWKFFAKEFPEHLNAITQKILLPSLSVHSLKHFPSPASFSQEMDEEFNDCWNHWSIQFQSKMPLFAQRFKLPVENYRHLHSSFIQQLAEEFSSMYASNLEHFNPLELLKKQLPTGMYYAWIWDTIADTMTKHFHVDSEMVRSFQHLFEDWLSETVERQTTNSEVPKLRLRFYIDEVFELLSSERFPSLTAEELIDLFNVGESFGLIEKYGSWFEFSHQLLFEEALYSSSSRNNNNLHTHFPSIQIRSLRGKVVASEGEIDENYDSIIHWTGGFYAYHPGARLVSSNLRSAWAPWREYAEKYLQKMESFYDSPMDEFGEKSLILRSFLNGEKQLALFLNGAPGTGKTYFCYHFLEYHLLQQAKPIKWRYVTLSDPLIDHFSTGWANYKQLSQVDQRLERRAEKSGEHTPYWNITSVRDLLFYFDKTLHRRSYLKSISQGGLLDFQMFKQLFNKFCEKLRQPFRRPGVADAWQDYIHCWHNPITGERYNSQQGEYQRMELRGKDRKLFTKFVEENLSGWKTYDQACFDASSKFLEMSTEEQQNLQHDLLMVDEIQDMTPPILTFLLLLSSKSVDNQRILLAGDQLQTVNRSGFDWKHMAETCTEALASPSLQISKPLEKVLIQALDIYSGPWTINTLRTPWRSASTITTFNDHLRKGFGKRHGIDFVDYSVDAAPNLSLDAAMREEHAQVTLVLCEGKEDFESCINLLKEIEVEVGEYGNTALLTPYDHSLAELDKFASFTTYNGETVKGLEFDCVVVAQPYELLYTEALSSLGLDPIGSAEMTDARLVSWVSSESKEAKSSLKKFETDLYDNIRTRMNVMFSRAKYRMVVLLRQPLGEGWKLNHDDPDNMTLVIDYPDPMPNFKPDQLKLMSIKNPTRDSLLQALLLPAGVGDVTQESRVNRAIESEKMRIGEHYQNIRNLWRSVVQSAPLGTHATNPIRSASLLGGYISNNHNNTTNSLQTVLHALRGETLDDDQVMSNKIKFAIGYDYICEKILLSLAGNCSLDKDGWVRCSVLDYADLCTHLEKILNEVLKEAVDEKILLNHPRLLGTLLEQVLGVQNQSFVASYNGMKTLEPINGLRILLDPALIEANNGSVVQLDPPTLTEIESMIEPEEISRHLTDGHPVYVKWNPDTPQPNVHNQLISHMYGQLKNPHSRQIIEDTRSEMVRNKLSFNLSDGTNNSSFWDIVSVAKENLPIDGTLVSSITRSVLGNWGNNQDAGFFPRRPGLVLAPSKTLPALDSVFGHLVTSWFEQLCSFSRTRLIDYAGLTFDLHSFLNRTPNHAVCELVILLKYGEVEALNWDPVNTQSDAFSSNPSIHDGQSGKQISLVEHWSKDIAECFGFTAKALGDLDHKINEERFSSENLLDEELIIFVPKMYYLEGQDSSASPQIKPLMKAYLKKFTASCLHYFAKDPNSLLSNKIASTLQHFVLPYDRATPLPDEYDLQRINEGPGHRSRSVRGATDQSSPQFTTAAEQQTAFGVTFHPSVYDSIIARNLLPLLSIVESTFECKYVGEEGLVPAVRVEINLPVVRHSWIKNQKLGAWFSLAFKKLANMLQNDVTPSMLESYREIVEKTTELNWPYNGGSLGRDLVKREHVYYWGKMLEIIDMNRLVFPMKLRERFRPHFLLPSGNEREPDDRAKSVKDSIEAIRRGLRGQKNRTEIRIWLSRACTYLAAPMPPRISFSVTQPTANATVRSKRIENVKENPTRALAIQCLDEVFKNANQPICPHYLDWSVFLMLSTISHDEGERQAVSRDVEVTILSITSEMSNESYDIAQAPPFLTVEEAQPLIDNFLKMLDDPYAELTARFTRDAVDVALRSSMKKNHAHPIIVPNLRINENARQQTYLSEMKGEFFDFFPSKTENDSS